MTVFAAGRWSPQGRPLAFRTIALPGFTVSLGLTLASVCLIVLLPLSAVMATAAAGGVEGFVRSATSPRALHAYALSLSAALAASAVNAVFGLIAAWTLSRYQFYGRNVLAALFDLPLALPTAVAGVALAAIYGPHGLLGAPLARLGIKSAYSELGIVIALTFVGAPFVVRSLEPVIEDLPIELEEAALTLGAGRLAILRRVIAPALAPAWLTGISLAFARAVGEYGSVIFIAGNLPNRTEIAPLLITVRLEEYDNAGAASIAVVILAAALLMLLAINGLASLARGRRS